MITNSVLDKLEFPKILQHISRYAYTDGGKSEILNIKPFNNSALAAVEGNYVTEAKEILIKNDFPPFTYLPDLVQDLSRSRIEGSVLDNKVILDILHLAETSRSLYQFLKNEKESALVSDFLNSLFVDKVFEHNITRIIDDNGEVKESASPKLKEIREEVRRKNESLRKVINRILKELSDSYLVREEYVTQRDGRIVVPVKSEHKRQVKGFIHSESSTGQTVYIEPEETLELNNDILSLYFAEKREIERILRELTKRIGEVSDKLKIALETISLLDSIFARAKYSIEIIGAFPSISKSAPFRIMDARHPLLIKKLGRNNTVPLNLEIEDKNVILITGPNAGGKTVVLKTAGILVALALSGIHIPVHPDSNIHFMSSILLDIGDQQSIEDDLSTFSSHLSNIRDILNSSGADSLVLLDEIGTGTDPAEGSALAAATLLSLQKQGSIVLATTHHGMLKLIANELEGFQNASMEFDNENLKPTYKFHQGLPGSSYAFEIAERIGFNKEFISLAKSYMDTDKTKVEDFLVELETRSKSLEKKLKDYELENSRLTGLAKLYQKNVDKLESQKKDIIAQAKVKADEYLRDINKRVEKAIRDIKESQAKSDIIRNVKKELSDLKTEIKAAEVIEEKKETEHIELNEGDYALIRNSQTYGKIVEADKEKNKAIVQVGNIRMQVKLSDLQLAKKRDAEEKPEYRPSYMIPQTEHRLDIRGQRPEEAEFEVIRFVDNAYTQGLNKIEILHGKGTGALKKMVKDVLSSHPGVKNYNFAGIEYGGEGITIVDLK